VGPIQGLWRVLWQHGYRFSGVSRFWLPSAGRIGGRCLGMPTGELIGRHDEVDRLDSAMDGVGVQGAALLIVGDPGIGKSSLLRAVASRARNKGFRRLEATGVKSEEGLAFAGLQMLLDPVISAGAALPTAQRKAMATAFGLEEGPPPQPFLVALAALNLLGDVASRDPVLVTWTMRSGSTFRRRRCWPFWRVGSAGIA
jgi:hypothetical protein